MTYTSSKPGIPPFIVAWERDTPYKTVRIDVDNPERLLPGERTAVLSATYEGEEPRQWREIVCTDHAWPARCDAASKEAAALRPQGASYTWSSRDSTLAFSPIEHPTEDACAPDAREAISWTPVDIEFELAAIEEDASGCSTLMSTGGSTELVLCFPEGALEGVEPREGERITVRSTTYPGGFGVDALQLAFDRTRGDETTRISRVTAYRVVGSTPFVEGISYSPARRAECGITEGTCGQLSRRVDLVGSWTGTFFEARIGERTRIDDRRTLWLTEAIEGELVSRSCAPWNRFGFVGEDRLYTEAVLRDGE